MRIGRSTGCVGVLMVGVSPDVCASLQSLAMPLDDVGWVTGVGTLRDALELCKQSEPDVLLMELPLRGEDVDCYHREIVGLPTVPAIVVLAQPRTMPLFTKPTVWELRP